MGYNPPRINWLNITGGKFNVHRVYQTKKRKKGKKEKKTDNLIILVVYRYNRDNRERSRRFGGGRGGEKIGAIGIHDQDNRDNPTVTRWNDSEGIKESDEWPAIAMENTLFNIELIV